MLRVVVISASDLPNVETVGKSDPYVVVGFLGSKKKTEVIKDELNPVWNEKFEWDLQKRALSPDESLHIQVKDWERLGRNRLLGQATVPLKELVKGSSNTMQAEVNLTDSNGRQTAAKVSLRLEYVPAIQKEGDGEITIEGIDEVEGPTDGEDDEEDGGDSEARKRRRKRKTQRHKLSNKPQDFQVRVRIIEGRQLSGQNISPVARVTVANQTRQTKVKISTNKPFYDETFFFNFNMSPMELFDEIISFEVFNSRKLRANAMIGYFKCDIGFFYEEPGHAAIRKWVLLTDPDDKMAGVKETDEITINEEEELIGKSRGFQGRPSGGKEAGYLKVTVMVLGPGDEAPASAKESAQDDNDDIETNLLQPSGVMLRPATFSLKVYRAEDIPQMDSGFIEGIKRVLRVGEEQKELVDPYLLFSFAGMKARTRIHYNSDHPEFNQELNVQFKFPSMCERLKLQMFDWDRLTADDCIGTAHLPMSAISGQGEDGFLPMFGPCFINVYGSTREYSDLPDEYDDLNLGNGEGVAYRGRVLVELETKLGVTPQSPTDDLQSHEIISVQPYLRRRKYKLFACFLEASMVSCSDGPVEFEVSIGNYGNKLDLSVPPSSSTTPPTNAVYDGCYYYFLPWGDTKPCVCVESHWEDIGFRLGTKNILTRMCERLEVNMDKVNLSLEANAQPAETATLLISLLDQLINDVRKPLPKIDNNTPGVNDLDLKLQEVRLMEKLSISEEAIKLRESATDVREALGEIEGFLQRLRDLTVEPQNSMPDVIIWMLSGTKRIAYYRIPAFDVLYEPYSEACGENCGQVQNIFMKYPGKKQQNIEDYPEVPAHVRMMIWLGLEKHQEDWTNRELTEGDFCVYAETYENEMNILGKWTAKGLSRPNFSNTRGDVSLPKKAFIAPDGWRFDGDWFVNPELSLSYDRDSGHKTFLEDVFQCESRLPGGSWGPATVPWTDVRGDAATAKDEIQCDEDWEWTSEWMVDLNRAVDEDGYEYTVESTIGGYGPVEKTYHLCRRRRWVRSRKLIAELEIDEDDVYAEQLAKEGWEYAPMFTMKFHAKERKMDLVRRRRWHRKMVQEDPSAPAVFHIDVGAGAGDDLERETMMNAPRMFITYEKPHRYQLRAYLFQARDLLASDPDGVSDPYARVVFGTRSSVTETLARTLCPTWDQTLIFDEVNIYGSIEQVAENPPAVIIELYDKDPVGKDEFMGRCVVKPLVKLNGQGPPAPRLLWYDVERGDEYGGEILAAFELFLDEGTDLPFAPPMKGNLFLVPNGIRPVMQRTAIEVLCWGVRNMKKFQLASVSSPSIEFECGGHVVNSTIIKNTQKNPNFDQPLFFFDVYLPKEELYTPPMNIKVRDNRSFGRKPMVGLHALKSLQRFRCDPGTFEDPPESPLYKDSPRGSLAHTIVVEEKKAVDIVEEDIDWWSKFYASIGDMDKAGQYLDKGYDKIMVYQKELDRVHPFNGFQDFMETFHIHRGKVKSKSDEEDTIVGEFKGTFRVYPLPSDPSMPLPPRHLRNLPPSEPVDCIIRVYVIRALDLQPQDSNGLADPYLVVSLGKTRIKDRDNYIANNLNPVFGKMFEMNATIPIIKDLKISLMDYDLVSRDDLIGETVVDLENRFLTRYRACCGLPQTYCTSGINQWRDSQTPRQILDLFCESQGKGRPQYLGNMKLVLDNRVYTLQEFEEGMIHHPHLGAPEQRLALHVLNSMPVVPEHVETRSLYNSLQPNIEQGKLQMWVDIFPKHLGTPGAPFNISPRKPAEYELRVIIWNTSDVILEETSITGEKMSDIYVKGWLAGADDPQKTDVHYRSLDGEGNFNWRFIFPFMYLPAEKIMVVKKKVHFWSLDETEERVPLRLIIQIWDNDQFSPDDFLGQLELTLNRMPKPAKSARKCNLGQLPHLQSKKASSDVELVSLFEQKRVYGWWPCVSEESAVEDEMQLTGKVEMALELLTREEAEAKPAGRGREEPNQNPTLEEPNRPATSFRWFTSPLKTLRYIIWRNYKWWIVGLLITLLIVAAVLVFLYAMPGYTVKKMFNV
ncbi:myoferlin isoform X2 [Nematostella vectensis]|uniref:myoferlin isoform X2 n=1 Tax=Nematostella vectensis TaxID=45351 RepID=UPI0013904BD1|nr:myoferlin isoform X2 [Nematostella vectensis]